MLLQKEIKKYHKKNPCILGTKYGFPYKHRMNLTSENNRVLTSKDVLEDLNLDPDQYALYIEYLSYWLFKGKVHKISYDSKSLRGLYTTLYIEQPFTSGIVFDLDDNTDFNITMNLTINLIPRKTQRDLSVLDRMYAYINRIW